jgi:hypothetical protein
VSKEIIKGDIMLNLKRLNLICLFFIIVPLSIFAQNELLSKYSTMKNQQEFFKLFEKQIAIDKENYNINIDYCDNNSGTIIFSGTAKNVGTLTSLSLGVLNSNLDFKIELKYFSNSTYTLTPQKLVYTYRVGTNSNYNYMSTSLLETIREELSIVRIYGPSFEVDSYFLNRLSELKTELEKQRNLSQDLTIKKKERKKAKKEFDALEVKYNVFKNPYTESEMLLTRIYLYYLNN